MPGNYGIRYTDGEDNKDYNPENNYGAWIPKSSMGRMNFREGDHQMVPKDYVPKKNRIMED